MNWIRFIVFSNIWISTSVAAFVGSAYLSLSLSPNRNIILLAFFATLLTYNFQRLVRIKPDKKDNEMLEWIVGNIKIIRLLSASAIAVLGYLLFVIDERTILFCACLAIISALYAYPFIRNERGLRDLKYIKIFLIAIIWTGTATLSLVEYGLYPNSEFLIFFILEKLFFVIAITIPFDIRDIHYDPKTTQTIPQVIGINRSIILANCLLIAHVVLSYQIYSNDVVIAYIINGVIAGILITGSLKKRPELYFTGIIDAIPVIQLILLMLYAKT